MNFFSIQKNNVVKNRYWPFTKVGGSYKCQVFLPRRAVAGEGAAAAAAAATSASLVGR